MFTEFQYSNSNIPIPIFQYVHRIDLLYYRLFSHHRTVSPTFSSIGDSWKPTIIISLNWQHFYFLGEGIPWLEWRKLSSDYRREPEFWFNFTNWPTEAGQIFFHFFILTRIYFLAVLAFLSCLIYIGALKINNNTSERLILLRQFISMTNEIF